MASHSAPKRRWLVKNSYRGMLHAFPSTLLLRGACSADAMANKTTTQQESSREKAVELIATMLMQKGHCCISIMGTAAHVETP
eukprot:4543449-Amphidinium_carterae.1